MENMWIAIGIIILALISYFLYEYKVKRPDEIVLREKGDKLILRKGTFYPRHFSRTILDKSNSLIINCDADARGKLPLKVKVAVTVSASLNNLRELVRIGGWGENAVANTAKEVEILLLGNVKAYTEKHEIEELTSEGLNEHLSKEVKSKINLLGLELVSLTVQSIDPADRTIAEAMKQKESARILEENERETQKARISTAQLKKEADEKIALIEHELSLKNYELKKVEEEKEAALANARIQEELSRKKLQLELDKEEMKMLKDNPELLLLSPQAARLAEASQNLKNAKTVVSLSKDNADQGFHLIGLFQSYLEKMIGDKK